MMLTFLPFDDEVALDESIEDYEAREASDAALFEQLQGYEIGSGFYVDEASAWEALEA